MGCNEISELLSVYIDDCLTADERNSVEQHLNNCPTCQREYNELKCVISQIQLSNPSIDVPENFMSELKAKLDLDKAPAPKIVKFNKFNSSRVFRYSSIAACVSLALLSATFVDDYNINRETYLEQTPDVAVVETYQPPVVTDAPVVTAEPVAPAPRTVEAPAKVTKPVSKPKPAVAVNETVISDGTKSVEIVDHIDKVLKNQSVLVSNAQAHSENIVIQSETDDKIVIAKLPTKDVKKLAYVTNVSLSQESVDVEFLGTSFNFREKTKYNTQVFNLYNTTKEQMYENSNICYEQIVDYTDEYVALANELNSMIDSYKKLTAEQIEQIKSIEARISEIDSMIGYNILIF